MTGSSDIAELPDGLRGFFRRSSVALALSGADPDVPLVLVNDAFCRLTGYSGEESVGRNCRFLQGPLTSGEQRRALRRFVHDEAAEGGRFPVLNYRKDGSRFLNLVFMSRLRDAAGVTRYILASQFDMTEPYRRTRLRQHDGALGRSLDDVGRVGREHGLAMVRSAAILADSAAMLIRLAMDDGGDARFG